MPAISSATAGAPQAYSGMFAQIYREIMSDTALLPSLPEIALRIRDAVADPNHDLDTIARVVQADPGVSVHLLRVANSPLYRTRVPISDVKRAIGRFGTEATRNMVTSYTLGAMYNAGSPILHCVMRETWRRSARLAAISAVLAGRCPGFDVDRAMLAGLLQDIGALPLLVQLGRRSERLVDLDRVNLTLDEFAPKVGMALMRHWGFDEELEAVVRTRCDWMRDSSEPADLADLVIVARLHSLLGTAAGSDCPPIDSVPAYARLSLGRLTPTACVVTLAEADHEIDEVMKILGV